MRIESSRNIIPQEVFKGAGNLLFPLFNHKRNSDRKGRHEKWTTPKHIVLTALAILTDVGINSAAAVLALSGNIWGTVAVKSAYNIAAWTLPKPLTHLKNRMLKNQP